MKYNFKSMRIIKRLNWGLKDKASEIKHHFSDSNYIMDISWRGQMQL